MRDNVRAFVAAAAAAFRLRGPVYEFGSYLVEGQSQRADLRPLFPACQYIGCDMRAGPGVDRIEDLARLTLPDDTAETIVCVDTLEHVFAVQQAVDEMIRVLRPGGMLLLSVPMDFRIHDYPGDYWRLTPGCLSRLLEPLGATIVGSQGVENHPHTVLAIGCKPPVPARFATGAYRFMEHFQQWLDEQAAATPTWQKLKALLCSVVRSKGERRRQRHYHSCRFMIHCAGDAVAAPDTPQRDDSTPPRSRLDSLI